MLVDNRLDRHAPLRYQKHKKNYIAWLSSGGLEVLSDRAPDELKAALAAAEDASATPSERAEMLMEMAMGLQHRPKSADPLRFAVELYDKALDICPADQPLLRPRIVARKGTVLQAIPSQGTAELESARGAFEAAIPILGDHGRPEELAEAEMNLGVVIQNLAGAGRARVVDAIAAYQRALRTFDRARYPQEFAILQNNLATAFLSMPVATAGEDARGDGRAGVRGGAQDRQPHRSPGRIRDAPEQSRQRPAICVFEP